MGLALLQLFHVGSPKALIFFAGPSSSVHLESFLTWSNALLKYAVLLSGEKTSTYIRYVTPAYFTISNCLRAQLCISRATYSQNSSHGDQGKIKGLLRRPSCLLPS